MSTTDSVLSGLSNLNKVEASLFEVVKIQLEAPDPVFEKPNTFGIYKGTGGKPLGVMGGVFDPMQPKEFMQNIVQTVTDNDVDLDLNTLQFNEYGGGEYIEFSLDLPKIEFTNEKKVNDVTEMKLVFTTSYNGSKSNQIQLFTKRLVCSNGMVAWGRDAEATLKAKNTAGGKKKILTYGNELMKVMAGQEDYRQKIEALNKIKVNTRQVNEYLSKLLKYDVTDSDIHPNSQKVLDKINEAIELEFSRTGETMYGLLNGITYYTNHLAELKGGVTPEEYIRFKSGAGMNQLAQQLAFAELN